MSQNPPATLSVKRKRNEAPVDALIFEHSVKRQRSQLLDGPPRASPGSRFYFKRLTKPNDAPQQTLEPPTPTAERRFHLQPTSGLRKKHVFVEKRETAQEKNGQTVLQDQVPVDESTPASTPRPRKRPGAASALKPALRQETSSTAKPTSSGPTEHDVRTLEAFSDQISTQDNPPSVTSPSKHKPHAPAQRFAQRHPEKAARLAAQDPSTPTSTTDEDAMDIDTDEYVYDTYIREPLPATISLLTTTTDPSNPSPTTTLDPSTLGTVGYLVLSASDTEIFNTTSDSSSDFATDDEDENAEDYYANDYPEDELSDDDEFGRDPYQAKNRHGSDDEEYDLENGDEDDGALASGEDEDDLHFRMTVPKAKRGGYWGIVGE